MHTDLQERAHVALAVGAVALLLPGPGGAANRHWLPAVQVSHEDYGSVPHTLLAGTASSPALHATVFTQLFSSTCNLNDGAYDYVTIPVSQAASGAAWSAAWAGRERFNWDNPDQDGWRATDARFALDANDTAHVAWEEHQIAGDGIGYKRRQTGWASTPPSLSAVPPDTVNLVAGSVLGATSPGVFIEPLGTAGVADDVLHVIFRVGSGYWHRAKVLGGTWGIARPLTGLCHLQVDLGAPTYVISSDRTMHVIGACTAGDHRTFYYMHLGLVPSGSDSMWVGADMDTAFVIDEMDINQGCGTESGGDVSEALALSVAKATIAGNERLHVVYAFDGTSPTDVRELRHRSYQLSSHTWSDIHQVTIPDGVRSDVPKLVLGDGMQHVFYSEGDRRRWDLYFDCDERIALCDHGSTDPGGFADVWRNELRYVAGRPAESGDDVTWSAPQPFTADMRTAFTRPLAVVRADTVFALFGSHEDHDLAAGGTWYDGNWETWFRMGVPMPETSAPSGQTVTWDGEVYLDRDFVVETGGTLIIQPGTVVVAASLSDSSNATGGTPGLVEVIIRGTTQILGDESHRVKFRSVDKHAGDWGGLVFPARTDGAASTIRYADFQDGTAGISLQCAAAPELDHLGFARNDVDILLARDVRIAAGTSWDLSAGTVVGAADLPAGDDGSAGYAGLADLLVDGILVARGTEGSGITFKAAASGQWGGVLFLQGDASADSLLHVTIRDAKVGIRFGVTAPTLASVSFAGNEDADILLGSDSRVAAGSSWRILAPARVLAAATPASEQPEGTPGATDLILNGEVVAEGTLSESVVFSTLGGTGSWGGLVADLVAAPAAYGYTCSSALRYSEVSNASAGIRILQDGAPTLDHVKFQSNASARDIVLEGSDVYVPYSGTWWLVGPTHVKIQGHRSGKTDVRNPGLVDLLPCGSLVTTGSPGDSVYFEPEGVSADSVNAGIAWGGIFLDWYSTGHAIEWTSLGYAPTPLLMIAQSADVRNSRIHHFRDQGIFALGSWSPGLQIVGNLVERGAGADPGSGKNGIVLVQTSSANVIGNTILIDNTAADSSGGAGLRLVGTPSYCQATSSDSLVVEANVLTGPGGSHPQSKPWSGIYGDWLCGAGTRKVFVRGNTLSGWNGAGMTFVQSKDVQVTCNTTTSCFTGVDFSRNTDVTGPGVRFRANVIEVGNVPPAMDQDVCATDNAAKLVFGPMNSAGDRGGNRLRAVGADWLVKENDESAANTLNAQSNWWTRNGHDFATVDSLPQYFRKDSLVVDPIRVDPSGLLDPGEPVDLCGGGSSSSRQVLPPLEEVLEEREDPASSVGPADLPERTSLVVLGPASNRVEVRFALAGREPREVTLEVFDVSGRRVRHLLDEALVGGRYGVTWGGVDEAGNRVGAGVYLIRMRAGAVTQVRKAVLVR